MSGNRSPKKSRKSQRSAVIDIEETPFAAEEERDDGAATADVADQDDEHPLAPSKSTPVRLSSAASDGSLKRPPTTVEHQYSETPSWIELKKWRAQMEATELHHLSLHQLARDGDAKRLRLVLDYAPTFALMRKRLATRDEFFNTPLHYATRYSHFAVIRLLVERGADVNSKGEDDARPLHFLARFKRSAARRRSVILMRSRTRSLEELDKLVRRERAHTHDDRRVSAENGSAKPAKTRRRSGGSVRVVSARPDKRDEDATEEDIVGFLVSHSADVNAPDFYGMTAMHHCAMRNNVDLVTQLLACPNIDIDARDHQEMTPLHVAAAHGALAIERQLLDAGADIRAFDEQSNTPLHYAAQDNHLNIVKLLMSTASNAKHGGPSLVDKMLADQDYESNTALFLAVDNGNYNVAKLLLTMGADANTHRVMFDSPLHAACVAGDMETVKLLIHHGAKIDTRNADQDTPLHKAAAYNHWQVCEYLLDNGAYLEATNSDGFTPLLITAYQGRPETLRRLLLREVQTAATDKMERTAFALAAEGNNLEVLRVLLEDEKVTAQGGELRDKGDRYMNQPLHKAAAKGYLEFVKALLEAGSKVNAKNEEEKTPLHLAAREGRTRIVRCLLKAPQSSSMTIYADEDEDSATPLHIAATCGHVNVARELIEAGANIAARNSKLWTPLDCAAAHGWEDTTTLLLDYDSPVDPVDKSKTTPLHLAAKEGHVGVLNLLLSRGATIGLTDHHERNCLDLAIENNNKDCAFAIVRHPHWRQALSNCQWVPPGPYRTTPLRKLIRSMPEVAEEVFRRCTVDNRQSSEDKGYEIHFDYSFLDDTYVDYRPDLNVAGDDTKSIGADPHTVVLSDSMDAVYDEAGRLLPDAKPYTRNSDMAKLSHPLMLMVRWQRQELLSHPLVRSLLRHKWNSHGRYVYYSFLAVYAVLVALLTTYVVLTPPTFEYFHPEKDGQPANLTFDMACRASGLTRDPVAASCQYGVLVLVVFHALKEVFQIYQRGWNYLSWENVIEWAVYISSFLFAISFTDCTRTTGLRMPWQWQLGALSVFLAWMGLVLYIQKLPRFGIYVVMFMDILSTFSSFFLVFVLFIVAFGLAFFVLLQNQVPFNGVRNSLIKTAVMMIGEFEFDSIFNDSPGTDVYYKTISYTLFCVFVIIMTIIIMNLLVGLAVDDIKAVQDQALLKRLAMQVQLVLQVEQMAPEYLRRRWIVQRQEMRPNYRQKFFLWRFKSALFGGHTVLSKSTISGELNRELDEMEKLKSLSTETEANVGALKKQVTELARQQDRQNSMLVALIRHLEVPWEEEDQYHQKPRGNSMHSPPS